MPIDANEFVMSVQSVKITGDALPTHGFFSSPAETNPPESV